MTLINYLNRVHFADNILEEALWAELDRRPGKHVMVLSDPEHLDGELAECFHAGFPVRKRVHSFSRKIDFPNESFGLELAAQFTARDCQTIVAFGPGAIIDQAKIVRLLVSQPRPLANLSVTEGGTARITGAMPDMIAVPTLRGFAAGFCGLASVRLQDGTGIDLASPDLIPNVTICDPVLALATSPELRASAGVAAIARCVEALVSPNYNPPADGIALDGLIRALRSIDRDARSPEIESRRDLMAASLNSALVQQKGLGLTHAIASALESVAPHAIDRGAVARLLLPEILRLYESAGLHQPKALRDALDQPGGGAADALRARLSGLPLPASLREMGIVPDQLSRAAPIAAGHRAVTNGPHRPKAREILSILQSVH